MTICFAKLEALEKTPPQQMTNEQLIDALSNEAFGHGGETERERELKTEILERMGAGG